MNPGGALASSRVCHVIALGFERSLRITSLPPILDLSELKFKLMQESGFGLQVQEETSIRYSMTQQDDPAPLPDEYLLSLLAPRYAAKDVAGSGGRERKLEEVFGSATHSQGADVAGETSGA